MPQYCLVKHHIVSAVIDGLDVGNEPDTLPISGDVTFYPILDRGDSVVVTNGEEKISYVLDPISARIVNGKISVDGEEGVKLFAGGPDSNPDRIRYRARFTGLNIAGSKSIDLKDILFEAVPGGELTLAVAQPVPGAPYPGYSATIEQGIAQIKDARDEALGQVSGAVSAEIGNTTHVISNGQTTHANKVVRLNADGKLAIGSGTVTETTDPANKGYVDIEVAKKADRSHQHNSPDIADATFYAGQVDNRFAGKVVKLNTDGKLYIHPSSITAPTDPANKGYVDTKVGDATQYISSTDDRFANKLVKLGSNGKLSINTSSITDLTDPVNKQYVDGAVTVKADRTHQHNAADIAGTTHYASYADDRFANQLLRLNASGKLHITTSSITGLNDPVNKQYVDSKVGNSAGGRLLWWN